jgi:hypothetical protein
MELLDLLDISEAITIGTATSSGRAITTPVGVVVVGDAGYVRSQRGSKGKWYQRATRAPGGFVINGDVRYPVMFEHVTDAETIRRADEATHRKYGGPLRSLLLKPLLWRTRNYIVKIRAVRT